MQAKVRQDNATRRVNEVRQARVDAMDRAATLVRKLYLGHSTKRRYQALKREFEAHVDAIVTMQRYTRGFLVRFQMWRAAIRAEEQLYAATEVQRLWRGHA